MPANSPQNGRRSKQQVRSTLPRHRNVSAGASRNNFEVQSAQWVTGLNKSWLPADGIKAVSRKGHAERLSESYKLCTMCQIQVNIMCFIRHNVLANYGLYSEFFRCRMPRMG